MIACNSITMCTLESGVPDGLVVPVVRFADEMDLPQISSQVKDYAARARDKKLAPDEMKEHLPSLILECLVSMNLHPLSTIPTPPSFPLARLYKNQY